MKAAFYLCEEQSSVHVKLKEMNSHCGEVYLFLNCLRRTPATTQAEALPPLTFCTSQRNRISGVCVYRETKKLAHAGTSLAAQCIRICLPRQGTQDQSLVWEDFTCCRATKPVHHDFRSLSSRLEPVLHNSRSHCSESPPATTESSPCQPQLATKTQCGQK